MRQNPGVRFLNRTRTVFLLLVGFLSVNGCFVFVPVDKAVPDEGSDVRLRLSPSREFQIRELLIHDVTRVDGVMFGSSNDSVAIWSNWVHTAAGNRFWSDHAVLYFDRADLRSFEERRWHPARTLVATGVVGAVGLGMLRLALEVAEPDPGKDIPKTSFSFVPDQPMSR